MILEAAQLINTNLWIDHLFGFVPRAITKEETKVLQETRKKWKDVPMEDRLFPYLAYDAESPLQLYLGACLRWSQLLLDKLLCVLLLASEAHYRYW